MGRRPCIPRELTARPFTLKEARRAGLTLSSLRSMAWRRLGAELYCWSGLRDDPWLVLSGWLRVLPREAVFAGSTAAWIHGLDLSPTSPVEVVVPATSGIRSRPGLSVRRCGVAARDTVVVKGLRATTLTRTLSDLCVKWPPVEALVAIDMAVHSRLADAASLNHYADGAKGRPGTVLLRSLAVVSAPAESPMETRLRWLLIQAGLPSPAVQQNLRDRESRFVGRADLSYTQARLVVEYDGGNHRERLVEDDRRQNLLINAGFRLLRFTAADIHSRPEVVVAQVRSALNADGRRQTARTHRGNQTSEPY